MENQCTKPLNLGYPDLYHMIILSHKLLGGDSQNFLRKFARFFITLGLEILRLFRLKVLFEVDIMKG